MQHDKGSPARRALDDLGDGGLLRESVVLEDLRAHLDESVERLLESTRDRELNREWRVQAALFLFRLEYGEAGTELAHALEEGDVTSRRTAFKALRERLMWGGEELEQAVGSSPAVRQAVDRALDDEDIDLRAIVIPLTRMVPVPRREERLAALVQVEDEATRYLASMQLVQGGHPGAIAALRAILRDGGARWHSGAVHGLVRVLDGPSAEGRRLAEEALAEHFLAWKGGPPPPSQQDTAIFLEHAGAESAPVIRHLFRVARDPYIGGHCMLAAVRLGVADGELEPRSHLAEPGLAPWAASALGRLHRGSGDAGVVAAIEPAAEICAASEVRRVLDAVLDVGGPEADAAADRIVATRAPGLTARLSARRGRGPEHFLRRAVELGIIEVGAGPDALRAAREEAGEGADPVYVVFLALDRSGVLAFFDGEFDAIPVPHDRLVRLFSDKSRGRFRPDDVQQTWNQSHADDDEADYTVTFRHGGREWSFDAANHGDYFDSESVVNAVNAALEESGAQERFSPLGEAWLFARPEAARAFAAELGLARPGPTA